MKQKNYTALFLLFTACIGSHTIQTLSAITKQNRTNRPWSYYLGIIGLTALEIDVFIKYYTTYVFQNQGHKGFFNITNFSPKIFLTSQAMPFIFYSVWAGVWHKDKPKRVNQKYL